MNRVLIIVFLGFISFLSSCQSKNEVETSKSQKVETYYTCSMHPQIKEDKPGKCPICHMNLTKVEVEHDHATDKEAKLEKKELWACENFPVATMKMTKKIRLLGQVEKVYVKSTGSFVKAGDPVVDIYSPKLITGGEEYILARSTYLKNRSREFRDLYHQSRERLELWGIKKKQYEQWARNGKIPKNITIYSPATGVVQTRNATVGKYFKEGQDFFKLSNRSDVWVEFDVYEQDSALVEIGQKVELNFIALPGETTTGEIDFVSPVLDSTSRTLKVRATIENKNGKLKPGMVANAQISLNLEGMPLVIPRSAVIDTGKRKVAWVKESDRSFKSKSIFYFSRHHSNPRWFCSDSIR